MSESELIMENYQKMVARQRKWMLSILAIIGMIAIVVPSKTFMLGLLIGAIISYYNLWLLQRRTFLLGEAAAKSGKRTGLGTVSRLAAAALGALLTVHYDLSIIGFVIGLVIAYPIIMIEFILFHRHSE